MDIWTKEKRSQVMARISGRNTKPEITVRKLLHAMGYRFRLHAKGLPARPDIVLRKHKTAILVHGCFWHLHKGCRDGTIPKSRQEYWALKLLNNKRRDLENMRELHRLGWKVIRLWECDIEKKPLKVQKILQKIMHYEK